MRETKKRTSKVSCRRRSRISKMQRMKKKKTMILEVRPSVMEVAIAARRRSMRMKKQWQATKT